MKSKIKQEIDKNIYRKFDNIVFVSNDNKEVFNKLYIMKNNQDMLKKEKVIYNYIDKERIFEKSKEQCELNKRFLNNKIIVTVARLVPQKAIDRLAKVHKKLIDEGINNTIYVIGDGPEKERLRKLIKDLKIEDTFKLLGKKRKSISIYDWCGLFCFINIFRRISNGS